MDGAVETDTVPNIWLDASVTCPADKMSPDPTVRNPNASTYALLARWSAETGRVALDTRLVIVRSANV